LNQSIVNLDGKKALVTGATGGIGGAIVDVLIAAGAKVIAQGRSAERLETLRKKYPHIICEQADFAASAPIKAESDQIEKMAQRVIDNYGGVDILINNAGIGYTGNVIDLDIAAFDRLLSINLKAVFILCKILGKVMVRQRDGYIINIGSGASTTPIAGMAAYCASKYGLLGLSESLALEMRKSGVKVSIIMPGSTATRFGDSDPETSLKSRPGILLPEDTAAGVMFLLGQPKRAWTSQMNLRPLDPDHTF
jgi:short-subunit dehydrogenase